MYPQSMFCVTKKKNIKSLQLKIFKFLQPVHLHGLVFIMDVFFLFYFRGVSSVVRKCTEKRTGKEYAVKIIDISGEKTDDYTAEHTKRDTIREINILKLCTGHPNISKYILPYRCSC